jgi:hypothetical protein
VTSDGVIISDVKKAIRRLARKNATKGTLAQDCGGNTEKAVASVNRSVAMNTVCVLRYEGRAVCATRFSNEALEQELAQPSAATFL